MNETHVLQTIHPIDLTFLFYSFRNSTFKQSVQRKAARLRDFDAHSPMFKNRHFSEEKRNRMF